MEDLYFYLAVILSAFVAYKVLSRKKHNYPPSPRALPIFGHLHLVKYPLYMYFQTVSNLLGPILLFWMGKVPVLVISSPAAFEECFTTNDVVFADRPKSITTDHLTYDYTFMVWAPHGQLWKSLRRLTFSEIFSQRALQRTAIVREEEIRHFVGRLLQYTVGGGKPKVDMQRMLSLLASNVIMKVAAGKRHVPISDEDTDEEERLLQQFKDLFFAIVAMTPCDFIPFLRFIGYKGTEKRIIRLGEKRDVFLNGLLANIRAKRAAARKGTNNKEGDKLSSVVDTILDLQETDPLFFTDEIVKGITMMMFIAGTETSTATLEWALTLLMQHPEKIQKLQAEIDNVVGDRRFLNEYDLANLPYLRAVVKETLRLYPAAPLLLPHFSTKACTVGGYDIPKGTMLMVNAWAMHRDPKLWEDPNGFSPERFDDSAPDGFLLVPFGVGRRSCPGAGMGTNIVSLGLGTLMQCFDWDKIGTDEDLTHMIAVASLSRKKPLLASFSPRPKMATLLSQL